MRPRISFTDEELKRIKNAATPLGSEKSDMQVDWVTTQDSLTAYILTTLGRSVTKIGETCSARVSVVLGVRSELNLAPGDVTGVGAFIVHLEFPDLNKMSLVQVAAAIRNMVRKERDTGSMRESWMLGNMIAGLDWDMNVEFLTTRVLLPSDRDVCLVVNNLTKMELPNFENITAGPPEGYTCSTGPTIFVGGNSGLHVFLNRDTLPRARHRKHWWRAIFALRKNISVQELASLGGA